MFDADAYRTGQVLAKRSKKNSSHLPLNQTRGRNAKKNPSRIRLPPLAGARTSRTFTSSLRQELQMCLPVALQASSASTSVKEFAFASAQGRLQRTPKTQNQDACLAVKSLAGLPDSHLFAVFDGHGPFGHLVSTFLRENLQNCVEATLSGASSSQALASSLKSAFRAVCKRLRQSEIDCTYSGSTCLCVLVSGSACVCASVGDSRAVIGRYKRGSWKAKPLSVDHRPTDPEEHSRIVNSGGAISPCYNSVGTPCGPLRVWLKNQHFPGLAVTRSIGDSMAAQVGVSSEPQVTEHQLTAQDKFLVLGTDGLWEVCSNADVASFVGQLYGYMPSSQACESLMRETANRWVRISDSRDDVTILVVNFG